MKSVDVLRDDGFQYAAPLQFRQRFMSRVGPDVSEDPMLTIKLEKGLRMVYEKAVGRHFLRTKLLMEPLAVYTVCAAEVRYAGLRGHPCAAEKDDAAAFFEDFPKRVNLVHDDLPPPTAFRGFP